MTGAEPDPRLPDPPAGQEPGEVRMVRAIRIWCKECRRARGAAMNGKGPRPGFVTCPHEIEVYAPGHAPGEAPADPSSPEERRQGPV